MRYNGEYDHLFSVIVKSSNHKTCLEFAKNIKQAVAPWFFQIKYVTEHKSARKGDVLQREIQIRHIAYPTDIITFNEMIRTLVWRYQLFDSVDITVREHSTLPYNSRENISNQNL